MSAKLICSVAQGERVGYPTNLFTVIGRDHLSGRLSYDVFIYASEVVGDSGRNKWRLIAARLRAFDSDGEEVVDVSFAVSQKSFTLYNKAGKPVCVMVAPRASNWLTIHEGLEKKR